MRNNQARTTKSSNRTFQSTKAYTIATTYSGNCSHSPGNWDPRTTLPTRKDYSTDKPDEIQLEEQVSGRVLQHSLTAVGDLGHDYCQHILGMITDTVRILLSMVQTFQPDLSLSFTPFNDLLQWGKHCLQTSEKA